MRRFSLVLLFAVLLMPTSPLAEEPAQPVPADGKCGVSVDDDWTPQEKFVWERVCAGHEADFNQGSAYGGRLDPRSREGLPESRILRPSFIETILLKDIYRRALTRSGVRIRGARFTKELDLENAAIGHLLELTGCLFERGINFRRLKSDHPINFSGSKVRGLLNLNGAQISSSLFLRDNAEFEQINLVVAHIGGNLDFSGSKVRGLLNLNTAQISSGLFLRDNAEFEQINLVLAHIGENLELDSAHVSDHLNMDSVRVGGHVFMRNKATFAKVTLTAGHVSGSIYLNGSTVSGTFEMTSIHIDAHLFMDNARFSAVHLRRGTVAGNVQINKSRVSGMLDMKGIRIGALMFMPEAMLADVDLEGAHIDLDVNLNGSYVAGPLNMNSVQIGGGLYMKGASISGDAVLHDVNLLAGRARLIDLSHSRIGRLDMAAIHVDTYINLRGAGIASIRLSSGRVGGDVNLRQAKIAGQLDMNGLRVEGTLLAPELQVGASVATSARIGGRVDLTKVTVTGKLVGTDLEVGRDLSLQQGTFGDAIQLDRARVRGDLKFIGSEFHGSVDLTGAQVGGELDFTSTQWHGAGPLSLRDAHAEMVPSLTHAGPSKPRDRHVQCPRVQPTAGGLSGSLALDLDGFTYRSIGESKDFDRWFAKLDCYTAQPYSQLAAVAQAQGHTQLATEIRYAGRDRERHESEHFLPWIWLTMLWVSIGYGYHLERALYCILFFVTVGAFLLWLSEQSWRNGLRAWGDKIVFSIDILLPVIKLRERNYQIELRGPLAYYFYFHRVMGFVLASFLLAGLSGLTK